MKKSKTVAGVSFFGVISAALVVSLLVIVGVILVSAKGGSEKEISEPVVGEISEENKEILHISKDEDTEKYEVVQEKIEESKTDEYKWYEQLPEEEKNEIEVIPREFEIVDDNISNEVDDEEKSDDIIAETLPTSFDLRDVIEIPSKNQADHGFCWIFASLRSLETNLALRKNEYYDFSEMHVAYVRGGETVDGAMYGVKTKDNNAREGGFFEDFIKEYLGFRGPVLESDVPYRIHTEEEISTMLGMNSVARATSVRYFRSATLKKERESLAVDMKRHIKDYGSLYTVIHSDNLTETKSVTDGSAINTYYDPENSRINHAISIIGWDDNFSKENFKASAERGGYELPENDGAWIAINSWGENWEIIYISYEDKVIYSSLGGIISTDSGDGFALSSLKSEAVRNFVREKYASYIYEHNNEEYMISINDGIFYDVFEMDLSNMNITDAELDDIFTDFDRFPNLYSINISNNNITDLSRFLRLELGAIDASNNNISDIDFVAMAQYSILRLDGNPLAKNLDMSDIQVGLLSLDNTWIFEDNSTLKMPHGIHRLSLSNTGMSNIDQLIFGSNKHSDIEIDLSNNYLTTTSGIEKIAESNSISLNLSGNQITNYDELIEILNSKEYIELNLSNMNIEDVDFLGGINIDKLDISNNNIKNLANSGLSVKFLTISGNQGIEGYSKVDNLLTLAMSNIDAKNLDEVLQIKKLNSLDISYNEAINDYSQLDYMEKLTYLNISGDKTIEILPKSMWALSLNDTNIDDNTDFSKMASLDYLYLEKTENFTNYAQFIDVSRIHSGLNIETDYDMPYELYKKLEENNVIIVTDRVEAVAKNGEIDLLDLNYSKIRKKAFAKYRSSGNEQFRNLRYDKKFEKFEILGDDACFKAQNNIDYCFISQ